MSARDEQPAEAVSMEMHRHGGVNYLADAQPAQPAPVGDDELRGFEARLDRLDLAERASSGDPGAQAQFDEQGRELERRQVVINAMTAKRDVLERSRQRHRAEVKRLRAVVRLQDLRLAAMERRDEKAKAVAQDWMARIRYTDGVDPKFRELLDEQARAHGADEQDGGSAR